MTSRHREGIGQQHFDFVDPFEEKMQAPHEAPDTRVFEEVNYFHRHLRPMMDKDYAAVMAFCNRFAREHHRPPTEEEITDFLHKRMARSLERH